VFKDIGHLTYVNRISYIDMQGALLSRIGFSNWEAVPTPGHTPDSISLYNETTQELICGDLILGRHDGRGCLNHFCWDEDLARDCFDILNNTLCVRTIYPGHGEVIRADGNAFSKVVSFSKKGGK